MNDTIQTISSGEVSFDWSLITMIAEAMIILVLLFKYQKLKTSLTASDLVNELNDAKDVSIDMTDLMNNIGGSRDLYKELSRKCHPDRFLDEDQKAIADKLFQDISRHKRNVKKLEELKIEAITKLGVTFK